MGSSLWAISGHGGTRRDVCKAHVTSAWAPDILKKPIRGAKIEPNIARSHVREKAGLAKYHRGKTGEADGADGFIENLMDMLVPVVTHG
ncbi:hypothetical protein EVAR_26533_1 [Eumeta japonica]|uniref:Uncharacterized protein n=1 Tax=Eumeta variegata TaxID=151549 RepID=A0A4C1YSF6_EUMVA|nr:hypothetical protein EVAR_26533_1 [Eumeta japonica]